MATKIPNTQTAVAVCTLKDAPALIERLWPAQKISAEAQKERKAVQGQTLVGLGSYWKGRKPLVLVRACILASLLPATDDPAEDLAVFEMLMAIDDGAFFHRDQKTKPAEIAQLAYGRAFDPIAIKSVFSIRGWTGNDEPTEDELRGALAAGRLIWKRGIPDALRQKVTLAALGNLSYLERVGRSLRPEELSPEAYKTIWPRVNRHLKTNAHSFDELVEQLGLMRFGHRPRVADTFTGGGSIPFEAARLGCDVYASDLNPIACMLSWGATSFLASTTAEMERFDAERNRIIERLDQRLLAEGVETAANGDRARIYLYCVEAFDRATGWRVPLSSTWILHEGTKTVLVLHPDPHKKRFDFSVVVGADDATYRTAAAGTVRSGNVHYNDGENEIISSLASIRGDEGRGRAVSNELRRWTREDVAPRDGDIYGERLCCIKWVARGSGAEYFAPPSAHDENVEEYLTKTATENILAWQQDGLVPNMPIESGFNTDQPVRERGWTHWHHLFNPRQLHMFATLREEIAACEDDSVKAGMQLILAKALNRGSRLCQWQPHRAISGHVFYNQALNTFFNYGTRAFSYFENIFGERFDGRFDRQGDVVLKSQPAKDVDQLSDIYITDPPYADAVHYHEITEFFIAWLRRQTPELFSKWQWDSRRPLAIKGDGEDFRREMIAAYSAMTAHMPDNGMQIVMFTHQSGTVWADMAQIFWGAGLRVQSVWYIATETTSELKKGGYVQGTMILALRKRAHDESGYEDEIAQEVRAEVARQIDTLVGLNQSLKGKGRIDNLFEDADLQMAGYAAALRVLTGYTRIDGRDMTAEASRPRKKGEKGFVERIIEFAVQVANEHMVPGNLSGRLWQQLSGSERFYLKMVDLEADGLAKLDNYQNFARAFRVPDYTALMANMQANAARLKSAMDFKRRTGFEIADFGTGIIRAVLYGIWELSAGTEAQLVLEQVRDMVESYLRRREDMIEVAEYIAAMRGREEGEGRFAVILANLLRNEKF
ncbi:hypothetical protein sphantq_02497 [Sphingobium sp. AntQ-1]|uniref:anti-phage-associated DUF1156 domain-containing protein n=1 Tax=Sphingobium sp. AntQ-1 TaxID=2930091 RepID=UPI00234F5341|nr:anti-phage-associated DUF1156 domain-containing protein [Sphingobium sp. AntQ-1]WCP14055.1 hypothetical protein sphantq_02497 [Sphingobium sp. AntQ-1]